MRLRARVAYKTLSLLFICAVMLLIVVHYFVNTAKDDAYLIHLPAVQDDSKEMPQLPVEKLLNLTNFKYILSNELCRQHDKELLAILIVTSYAGHDDLRAAHRAAAPQSKLAEMGFQRVFLLAQLPPHERFITQEQLQSEQSHFGDLLQGNFQEAYRNLTYKHTMGLRWAATNCARAKFIVKLDDDIVYDVFQLRRYLETLEVEQSQLAASNALLAGYILEEQAPKRNVANKWYVSRHEYAPDVYPPFLSGWLYITNAATALRLVQQAHNMPYFWIDDTWLTGLVRARLQIPLQRLNAWYSANPEFIECCVRDLKLHNYECEYHVGPNGGDSRLLVEFLHNVEKCYFDECVKRAPEKSLKLTCVTAAKHLVPDHGVAQIEPVKL